MNILARSSVAAPGCFIPDLNLNSEIFLFRIPEPDPDGGRGDYLPFSSKIEEFVTNRKIESFIHSPSQL
jgi:hypothetical protein